MHAAPQGLGPVERHVGAGEKLLGGLGVMGRQGNADAGFGMQTMAQHVVRAADVLQYAAGEIVGEVLAIHPHLQDGKLVTAEAADHVARTQAALQPAGHALQQAISHEVAVPVVDLLEVVEIEPQQREALAGIIRFELVLEALAEMEAVGDFRQRVVTRQPFDLFVGPPLRGDVFLHVDPTAACERLVGHADDPAVGEILNLFPVAALLKPRHMLLDPRRGTFA